MLACQRDLFQLADDVTFLNCAYMSPQLKCVEAAGAHALVQKNQPHRIRVEHFYEPVQRVKEQFARLINCAESGRIAFIPSASYGLSTVANNLQLKPGDEIIVLQDQFPSNYYPWEQVAREQGGRIITVGVEEGPGKGQRWNQAILEAINERTVCVALSHVHWAEGVRYDLEAIRTRTREVGAWLVIDGTQSVGALPFDVAKIQPDALVCAAYKWLMGPYSTGLAYFGPALDGGQPIEENWINRKDSHDFRKLVDYQSDYQPLAGRYCVGEQSNFLLIPMLEAALMQLNAWGIDRIQEYCQRLNAPHLASLQNIGVETLPSSERAHHLVGLRLPHHWQIEEVQQMLVDARVYVSARGESIRVAPNVYNQKEDWERLVGVLYHYESKLRKKKVTL